MSAAGAADTVVSAAPAVFCAFFAHCIASEVEFSVCLHRSGDFKGDFRSILVLIYAALFTLTDASVLVHKCVVQKRMRRWDRGRISLLNIVGMPGANSVL